MPMCFEVLHKVATEHEQYGCRAIQKAFLFKISEEELPLQGLLSLS